MIDKTIDILRDLIAFPTVSTDSNAECIAYIQDYLEGYGARCKLSSDTPGKANLFATIGPDVDGGIILSGHTDVVPVKGQNWSTDPFELVEKDGLFYGRGTCDMKGFIACALAMVPEFTKQTFTKPVHFAFTYDEETGCLGARVLIDQMIKDGLKPDVCIIGEPTDMRIIEGHKGCCEYTVEFTGVEGHSSQPALGVNALEYATRYITKLMDLRQALPEMQPEGSRFDPPHSTLSVCGLHSGVAHNVIPNKAIVEWEMRVVQDSDKAYIRDSIQTYVDTDLLPAMKASGHDCHIEETFTSEVDGLEPDETSEATQLVRDLTGQNSTDVVSFGTEAGMFQKAGVSTVICGPGSITQAHKPDEFVSKTQLENCLDMLMRLSEKLR